ncbi:reverse gyrase [Lebetimonas natsushimae]|uniref:Reverse gyrase n=1 Tax=Lebetimonas natsushimae TaxID=1936991 RepID=A0A292YEC0_9BACT|nr:reverse gyrase [Lebetimonas natsushimae]GAX88207.1 reverse gyrase [Lebetimonas natsushimae]
MEAIYKNRCPNCGGNISSERLEIGLFCEKCMDISEDKCNVNLINYKKFCVADEKLEKFNLFFREKVGQDLSPIQRMWAKRFFLGNSFALLAPTGIGKTTFGLLLAAFAKKSYIVFPTKLLVLQALERFKSWGVEVLAYTGKKEEKEKIEKGEYDILITTTQFLYKNHEIINKDFDLVFIDDVDSILKSARKIDIVLKLLGINEKIINTALELIEKKDYVNLMELKIVKKGNLIVSSATANPKSKRVLLFKYLLGFEVSRPNLSLRNIEDVYDETYSYEKAMKYIKKLGSGGLLFLPGNETKDKLNEFIEFLNTAGIKTYSYEEFNEHVEEFKRGECVFAGFASYRNPLARGIDLPESVRYTLFVGVPKIEFKLNEENYKALYFICLVIYPLLIKKLETKEILTFQNYINTLKRYAFLPVLHPKVEEKLKMIKEYVTNLIETYRIEIKNSPEVSFDGEKIITADITGYIQASGRSSRFYNGHLTKGLALTLIDNEKAFFSLRKKLNWYSNIEFKNIKEINLDEILKEIDESRKIKTKTNLKTSFVVVESPTKAKTISSFFGRPSRRIVDGVSIYEILLKDRVLVITASIGHDFDLSYEEKWGVKDKYIPIFRVLENKDKILNALNLASYEVDEVIIATDPDREGEKIAFDLILNNKPYNLNVKRAEFHEITKYAFTKALNNLRYYDKNLVAAQFVRRISDRWIGFNLSSYLQNLLHNAHLSAGRVQTPVLNWICERTEKLKEKIFIVSVKINDLKIEWEFEDKEKAEGFFNSLKNKIEIKLLESKEEDVFEKPFNTSTLLKEAATKLHFSPQYTMKLAQELFENGFITYHRTDSFRISNVGKKIAKEYIEEKFGEEYVNLRSFESGGAHEAIRATTSMDMNELKSFLVFKNINLTYNHLKLYDLIFRKFIASQMRDVKVKKDIFKIVDKEVDVNTKILEDGFNLVYPIKIYNIKEGIYPVSKNIYQKSKFPPYTYAEVIDEMKNKGIGRPSTYAITVEKLLERKYVVEKNGFLFATKLGFKVLDILKKHPLYKFVSEIFTKTLEETMDLIEEGKKDYKSELIKLYNNLFIG